MCFHKSHSSTLLCVPASPSLTEGYGTRTTFAYSIQCDVWDRHLSSIALHSVPRRLNTWEYSAAITFFFPLLKFRGNFHVPSFASLTPQHKSPWLFLIKPLKSHSRCCAYKCPSVPSRTQSPTKSRKVWESSHRPPLENYQLQKQKGSLCNFDLLPWEIFILEYCKMDPGSPPHVEFHTYRFNQVWIENTGLKRNWGWSGTAWAI